MLAPKNSPQSANKTASPNRITRLQEKADLSNLNDRLALYIDKVRFLEVENNGLRLRATDSETDKNYDPTGLKSAYQMELANARQNLDSVAKERAKLQSELGKLQEDHKDLTARTTKKETELKAALKRLKDLEAQLNSKDASLFTAQGEKRSLEMDVRELKAEVAKLNTSLNDAWTLKDEMLRKVDGEKRFQAIKEELEFQKNLHSEELREVTRRHDSRISEMNNGHQQEFESKLANALMEMRKQHETQVNLLKDELAKTYKTKLEKAHQMADRNSQLARTSNEELQQTRIRVESLSCQIGKLQKQLSVREAKVRDLEDSLTRHRDTTRRLLGEKDQEMAEIKQQMLQWLDEYQELLDVKLALDMEICAYRNLLEGEEERLCLSKRPQVTTLSRRRHSSSVVAHSRSANCPLPNLPAKRRRANDTDSEASSSSEGNKARTHITQQSSASGRITVDEVDLDGKYVRLNNKSNEDQNLGNWQVKRQVGSNTPIVFKFPSKFTLKAGQTVTIWSSGGGGTHSPPSELVWKTQSLWGIGEVFQTTLISTNEEEMATRKVMCTQLEEEDDTTQQEAQSTCGGNREYQVCRQTVMCGSCEVSSDKSSTCTVSSSSHSIQSGGISETLLPHSYIFSTSALRKTGSKMESCPIM